MAALILLYLSTKHLLSPPIANAAPIDDTIQHEGKLIRWQKGDDTRSTAELLTTCYITYFACIWKSIHANRIPSRSKRSQLWYKLYWAAAGILAPEFILWAAMSQYIQAQILQAYWWAKYSNSKVEDPWRWWGVVKWRELVARGTKRWRKSHGQNDEESVKTKMDHPQEINVPNNKHSESLITEATTDEELPRESNYGLEIQMTEEPLEDLNIQRKNSRKPSIRHNITSTSGRRQTTRQTTGTDSLYEDTETTIVTLCKPNCKGCRKIKTLKETDKESGKTYEYRSLPMVVAQFALMGGFILKLEDADNDWDNWKEKAKKNRTEGGREDMKMELIMQGLRPNDNVEQLLEDINKETFITTIRGRGFFQLIRVGAFDGYCIRRRIAQKSAHDIVDKCKADSVSKALVCIQVTWMLLNVLARLINGLPVTLLETHVVIQVGIAILTYAFWWNKPLDAQEAIEIKLPKLMIQRILQDRDNEADLYRKSSVTFKRNGNTFKRKSRELEFAETGLYAFLKFPQFHIPDFITESTEPESFFESIMRAGYDICETFFDLYWHTGLRKRRAGQIEDSKQLKTPADLDERENPPGKFEEVKISEDQITTVDSEQPGHTRTRNTTDSRDTAIDDASKEQNQTPLSSVHRYAVIITAFMGVLDCALHLTAWNLYFPTQLESLVWKIACLIGGGLPVFLFASKGNQLEYYPAILCFGPRRFAQGKYTFWRCIGDCFLTFHRIGTMRYGGELHAKWYRSMYEPFRLLIAYGLFVGAVVCILSLGYINVEAGFAMRRLPESSYKSIHWIEYIPHF